METGSENQVDIQAKVLQNTLDELAISELESSAAHQECCVICLETITEVCEARPCQHTNFDFVCLLNWLEQQQKCPLCKTEIVEVRYESQSSGDQRWETFKPEMSELPGTTPTTYHRPRPPRRNWPYYRPPRQREHLTSPVESIQDDALCRRRQIYRDRLYSLHVGTNRVTQYRELTPQLFEQDPALVSRARMWLRRELRVFEFLHTPAPAQDTHSAATRRRANNAEFLLEYMIAIIKTVDIQGSQGQAEDMLQEFLGRDNTRLLLHELKSFLRSPFPSLEAWDRAVQYPAATSRKRSATSSHTSSRSGSSRASPRPASGEGGQSSRLSGDLYRPIYSDRDSERIGSARRQRSD